MAAAQRRRLTGARGEGATEVAPALNLLKKAWGRAANEKRGSNEPESHRRRGIEVAEVFTGGEVVGEIRPLLGPGLRVETSGRFLASGRNRCGGPGRRRVDGAAQVRRRRELYSHGAREGGG